MDWALVDQAHPGGLRALAQRYDHVIAFPSLLATENVSGTRGRVTMLLDEPLPYTHPDLALRYAARAGACAVCALAHFYSPSPRVLSVPPPYLPRLFDAYAGGGAASKGRARSYFVQKRTMYAAELSEMLRGMGYESAELESWSFSSPMNTHDYLARLSACRWVLDLDAKASAGQVRARGSPQHE